MAHHNFDMPDKDDKETDDKAQQRLMEEMERLGRSFGATGRYPEGHYSRHDEGEILFGVAADIQARKVLVDFGKSVHSLGMTVEQAEGLIDLLQKKVWEICGIK